VIKWLVSKEVLCHYGKGSEMTFTTYENRNNPHIAIHHDQCNQIRKNGGIGRGEYREHETYDQARLYAESTGLPIIDCSFCNRTAKFSK
jgi:hypothetical protein